MSLYEEQTQELILQRMLERVPAKFDKREGSIIWDATAPASVELQNFYIALDTVLNEVFADTASREYLIKRCAERGITPEEATYATVIGQFTPASLEIPIGSRYSHEDYNYIVTDYISDGYYHLQCETIGSAPNGTTGKLIPIDYVSGLETAEIVEVVIPGEDEEDTEALRARYFQSVKTDAFGGNKVDYKTKVKAISGVGGVKIYSGADWNGGGTVKVVIINSDYGVPSSELVDNVQTQIDPETNMGEGVGIAPIGHFVTVMGAYDTVVNITMDITYDSTTSWGNVKVSVFNAIDSYFATLNKSWESISNIIVRIAHIESRILDIPGIVDVQNTTLNGKAENLSVDKDSLVSRGTFNGN